MQYTSISYYVVYNTYFSSPNARKLVVDSSHIAYCKFHVRRVG